jgi:hypothetical protein
VLDANSKAKLFEPGLNDYALGWFVRKDARGRWIQSHGGAVRGFVCELRRYPGQDACLFVLCNRDDVPVQQVARALEALLLGDPLPFPEPPRPLDAELVQALAGRYEAMGTTLVIEADGKVTRAMIHWSAPRGPVTRAVLGLDDRGQVILYKWTASTKIEIARAGRKPANSVSILGRRFRRVASGRATPD